MDSKKTKNKIIYLSIFLILIFSLYSGISQSPATTSLQGEVDSIQNLTSKFPINPATGKIDTSGLDLYNSKSEIRINQINQYLVLFTPYIFGTSLQISFDLIIAIVLFTIIFYLSYIYLGYLFYKKPILKFITPILSTLIFMQLIGRLIILKTSLLFDSITSKIILLISLIGIGLIIRAVMKSYGITIEDVEKQKKEILDRAVQDIESAKISSE
jgi:hypothetical protein